MAGNRKSFDPPVKDRDEAENVEVPRPFPYSLGTTHGGRSSVRLERQVVALKVAGSNPVGHPTSRARRLLTTIPN